VAVSTLRSGRPRSCGDEPVTALRPCIVVTIDGMTYPLQGRVALMVAAVVRESPKFRRFKSGRLELHFGGKADNPQVSTTLCESCGPVQIGVAGSAFGQETA
jgi:hypothetical protein